MKIKLFIFGLVFACLGLTSFSSASTSLPSSSSYGIFDDYKLNFGTVYDTSSYVGNIFYCFTNLSNNGTFYDIYLSHSLGSNTISLRGNSVNYCFYLENGDTLGTVSVEVSPSGNPSPRNTYYFDVYTVPSGGGGGDCSTCENQLSSLSGAYQTLSGYYSTCQSNLSICQGSLSGYDSCQGSLSACIEDNISLENMNSSLQDQLSQCLASGGTSCDPEVDEDCYTGAYQLFHIFRQNQGSDFSLPISNNIFLPNGLRAYTDSGVVALAPLTPSDYSLDHESGEILNDLVIKIFYYLAVLLSVMALAYYIKKFLSFTLFPKKD